MNNSTGIVSTHFGWLDYAAFGLMVALSTIVGSLIGVFGKQNTKVDYLLGGRNMMVLPIAVSLVFSHLSGVSLIGITTEVYTHGTQYYAAAVGVAIASLINCYVFLPVFFELKLMSSYEYLEFRFNPQIRVLMSLLYDVAMLLYIPIVIYVPGLTFNQVAGVDMHLVTWLVSTTCIIYTMLGGIKAVVWTDFLQSFVAFSALLAVVINGVTRVGGFEMVFQKSYEGDRLQLFNLDPSPLSRNTFWTVTLGSIFSYLQVMVSCQGTSQKIISLPNVKKGRRSMLLYVLIHIIIKSLLTMAGLTIYATYYDCDPITAKKVRKPDQVVPYFVMDTMRSLPGLPGLFVAGIFSAALSTTSSTLNCMSATIYEDIVLPCLKRRKHLEKRAHIVLKIIVAVFGALCVLMVYGVEYLGAVFDVYYLVKGMTNGAFLGTFCLGMWFPWANAKGAVAGIICSISFCLWIALGTSIAIASGKITYPYLPMTTDGCTNFTDTLANFTTVRSGNHSAKADEVFPLYRVSYWLYTCVGTLVVLIVGLLVSWITGFNDPRTVDPKLIVPFMKRFAGPPANPREEERLCQQSQSHECSM